MGSSSVFSSSKQDFVVPILSDKNLVGGRLAFSDTDYMSNIKEAEIYPKFEFRLSHREKEWLSKELEELKAKFGADGPAITKNDLVVAALRHGLRYLREREKICEK